jgi:cyclophilin family peptidyl-prolyl cis-trans isomerase
MRHLLSAFLVLLTSTATSMAQLYADFTTSLGNFTCELHYKETPRTVGNFISLAEGTRAWVDSRNGQLSTVKPPQPFYSGTIFHRVVNANDFKIIQAGSKRSDGSDGPGYEFPDEINATVPLSYRFDHPYYLAMANSGPNTNGSQFFLTGNAIPGLEGKHTVFGRVISGQSTIDAILNTPLRGSIVTPPTNVQIERPIDDVVIQSVIIRRVGSAAAKFKASSQKLPTLSNPKVKVQPAPSPASTNRYFFSQGQRSEMLSFATIVADKSSWIPLNPRWLGPSPFSYRHYDVTYGADTIYDFRTIIAKYNTDAITPNTPIGYALTMVNAEGSYIFSFPQSGPFGYFFKPADTTMPEVTGVIVPSSIYYSPSPHHAIFQFQMQNFKIMNLHLGFDKKVKNNLHGRVVSTVQNFVVTNPTSGAGFFFPQSTSPGGEQGFSMSPIK